MTKNTSKYFSMFLIISTFYIYSVFHIYRSSAKALFLLENRDFLGFRMNLLSLIFVMMSKNLLLWNCLAKMSWNLVGSSYGGFCIKFPQSRMKG
jgi:hypothetical protein